MCGIIGYTGSEKISHSVLIEGLKTLAYRGYDSAGLAIVHKTKINIIKEKGHVCALEEKMHTQAFPDGCTGIAHTRWATHGIASANNSHPHQVGQVTLVHNGIIENHAEIRKELCAIGYTFTTETDSEIACAYIDYCYRITKHKHTALSNAYQHFQGSFAFAILFDDEPDVIYAMRLQSPLIFGIKKDHVFLSSDISAFLEHTNHYLMLGHEEIARCSKQGVQLFALDGTPIDRDVQISDQTKNDVEKHGFNHYMMKEIHEEPAIIKQLVQTFMPNDLSDLMHTLPDITSYQTIHIVACGSALYAGMIAKSLIETHAGIPVTCTCASEYRYDRPLYPNKTIVILLSQSGETADTLSALHLAKSYHIPTLAIVNVMNSSLARESDFVVYTNAGREVSVATTKAYSAQVAVLSFIACKLAYDHHEFHDIDPVPFIHQVNQLPEQMKQRILQDDIRRIAKKLYTYEHIFFMGRGIDYALSLEGALKLKEISYIHSEAYPAGELKHGTISLIENNTPVLVLASDPTRYKKTLSNMKEVKARGAYIVLITCDDMEFYESDYDEKIIVPRTNPFFQGLLTVLPLQLLAYHIANERGCEIDCPRNLAKSVTVE